MSMPLSSRGEDVLVKISRRIYTYRRGDGAPCRRALGNARLMLDASCIMHHACSAVLAIGDMIPRLPRHEKK